MGQKGGVRLLTEILPVSRLNLTLVSGGLRFGIAIAFALNISQEPSLCLGLGRGVGLCVYLSLRFVSHREEARTEVAEQLQRLRCRRLLRRQSSRLKRGTCVATGTRQRASQRTSLRHGSSGSAGRWQLQCRLRTRTRSSSGSSRVWRRWCARHEVG